MIRKLFEVERGMASLRSAISWEINRIPQIIQTT
jgi:hypothetical protein